MASADVVLTAAEVSAVPQDYTVQPAAEIMPLAVTAQFDGSAAASAFLPTLEILAPSGQLIAAVPAAQIAGGDSGTVTWAPFLGGPVALKNITPAISPRVKLFDYTLPANAVTIDTLTDGPDAGLLATDFDVLEVWISSRLSRATVGATMAMTFNNDAGANYRRNFIQSNGTVLSGISAAAQNNVNVDTHGDAGSGDTWGQASFECFGYALTDRAKTGRVITNRPDATTGSMATILETWQWTSDAAVTRIAITPIGGGAGEVMLAGTRMAVFAS